MNGAGRIGRLGTLHIYRYVAAVETVVSPGIDRANDGEMGSG
jgi:hypothetical protein